MRKMKHIENICKKSSCIDGHNEGYGNPKSYNELGSGTNCTYNTLNKMEESSTHIWQC